MLARRLAWAALALVPLHIGLDAALAITGIGL